MRFLVSTPLFLLPAVVQACPVCMSSAGEDMAKGFYWGIILLLVLPPLMILAFAGAIFRAVRKNRRLSSSQG